MPINPSTKIAFVHIPRCGGTYIEHIMGIHITRPDSGFGINYNLSGDLNHLFGRNLQHLTFQEMLALLGNESSQYHWFSIIRDPKERLLSILCHTMGCPEATFSLKKLFACIAKIYFVLLKFHIKAFAFSFYFSNHYHQIFIRTSKIQHLNQQYNYVHVNNSFKLNKTVRIELYPFNALNEISKSIPSIEIVKMFDKKPNASKKQGGTKIINDIIIGIFSSLLWPKDKKLFTTVFEMWKKTHTPLIIN